MSQPPNPFQAMMDFTQNWVKSVNPALETFTPKGFEALWPTMPKELMESFMGKTFNPEGLDAKTKMLLTLSSLTIMGAQAEAQVRITVRHAVEAGASKQEIAETIGLAGVFGGVPAMTKAMELAGEVIDGKVKPKEEGEA